MRIHRQENEAANRPCCCVCGGPVLEDVGPLLPGARVMHAQCNRLAHQLALAKLRKEGRLLPLRPPCDVCQRPFAEGQRTADSQICEECLREH